MRISVFERLLGAYARFTDRWRVWYSLPFVLALPGLIGHRINLRRGNILDVERDPKSLEPMGRADRRGEREADGSFNSLGCPWMGMAGARFGRNAAVLDTFGETLPGLLDPNPRLISSRLLARKSFIPVPHLNVLAAAWLQFMVHDWLSHGASEPEDPFKIPVPPGDDWPDPDMTIRRTASDAKCSTADEGLPATYRNTETHWWDASQIYGSQLAQQMRVRTDPANGKLCADGLLYLDADGLLPLDSEDKSADQELAGVNGNWWIGLSLFHTLFVREHNAIARRLKAEYPQASGEWLFQKARLANAALIAKIHTTEWTPSLMNSEVGRFAMRSNWWGILGEHRARGHGRVSDGEVISGIPGSPTDHHGAPYAMTEEFTAVYRMHSLLPDHYSFRAAHDDSGKVLCDFGEIAGGGARRLYSKVNFSDAVYSLATLNPGALVLHNYPTGLRRLVKDGGNGLVLDIAAIDILRDRERGVPRYCAFRKSLGMKVPRSFEELTGNAQWREDLRDVYGSVDKVDLLVGMHCETGAPGFGFSDTAFRIFILLASRRLKSDRFFTEDFTADVYTPAGFAWVRDNDFRSVMTRHLPELAWHFADVRNLFFPWRRGAAAS